MQENQHLYKSIPHAYPPYHDDKLKTRMDLKLYPEKSCLNSNK